MKKSAFAVVLIVILLLLPACAASNKAQVSSSPAAESAAPASESAAPTGQAAAFPRDVDSAGSPVTLKEQPKKVGLATWTLLELLFPFDLPAGGVTLPFAAANSSLESDIYKPYVDKFGELQIVGENSQVNLEAMLAFDPDVIIGGSKSNETIKQQLEQIAPTVLYDEEKLSIRNDWAQILTWMGGVLGQEARAQEVIDNFNAKLDQGKGQLAGRSGETALFVQVREKVVYVMGAPSLPQYYEGLGLTPPDLTSVDENGQITLEGLSQINPDHLFLGYFNWTNKSLGAITDDWENSEVWKSLKAVKNNQVYSFNGELAFGLGPIGQSYGIDAVVEALK